jgi:toxin ParE1/3/4
LRLLFDPAAKAELSQAALYYEDCRHGLGEEFLVAVEAAFDQIRKYPTLWRTLKGRFRRYLVQQFPYGVIYAVEGRTIYVAAVMHVKRKPGYWASRNKLS